MTPSATPVGRLAIIPGSFDPLTNGHVDIILRSAHLFERIIVAVLVNAEKRPLFTSDERVAIIREVFKEHQHIEADAFGGLFVDYARQRRASGTGMAPGPGPISTIRPAYITMIRSALANTTSRRP